MSETESASERHDRLDEIECSSVELLNGSEIIYKRISRYHFLVEGIFDYWPRTGLFIHRKTKLRGRGVFNLMKIIKRGKSAN